MYVIGTAGHVDHGKSTLIRWLTGIDPDRLKEEKERQMTIDLGFAWMTLFSGEDVGFVDVPGHQDFIENMLVGIGGIDAVLFVIAADEGIMPQTREHLAILNLLKIKRGLIVLTKIDLINDPEWLDLIKNELLEFTKGTFLENVPIIEVSATADTGIDRLTKSLDSMIQNCPPKQNVGRPRLPVDRVFSLKGFGTIVTGTLLDGELVAGEQVVILPEKISTRIRGLETHKKKVEKAKPGSRTAVNLTNVDVSQIRRGDVITLPGQFEPTGRIDAVVEVLKDANAAIKHNDQVKIFIGTKQAIARVRVIGSMEIFPGQNGYMQLEFDDNLVAYYRDRFIIRRPSPQETIAGGLILDPYPSKRHRRFSRKIVEQFSVMELGSADEILTRLAGEIGPISAKELIDRSGINPLEAFEKLKQLVSSEIVQIKPINEKLSPDAVLISKSGWQEIETNLVDILKTFHSSNPLRPGIPFDDLRKKLQISPGNWPLIIEVAEKQRIVELAGNAVKLPTHEIQFDERQKEKTAKILREFKESPYMPPSIQEIGDKYGTELVQALIDSGELVKTSNNIVFRSEEYEKMLDATKTTIKEIGSINLAEFRDMFQTSRKFALSFLEHLDSKRITVRKGESRILGRNLH